MARYTPAGPSRVFIALFFISAPYGRYNRRGWGPPIPSWLGWLLRESVSAILMLAMFLKNGAVRTPTLWGFLLMWEAHYIHRAFIYPFGLRDKWKPLPVVVALMGGVFNLGNAYLNSRYLFDLSGNRYRADWLTSPQFITGLVLFVAGFVINRQADAILHSLAFALWTFANLVPRARAHHRWYHQHFPEYPGERKALIPGVW